MKKVMKLDFGNDDEDSAAIAIRNYFLSAGGRVTTTGWREAFLRTMNAISYFMRRKRLHVIKGVKEEAYPLPKGKKGEKA